MDVANASDSSDSERDEVLWMSLSKRVILKVMMMVRIVVIITMVDWSNQYLVAIDQGEYKIIDQYGNGLGTKNIFNINIQCISGL